MCQYCENTCSRGIYFDIPNENKLIHSPGMGLDCYVLEDSLVIMDAGEGISNNIVFCPMCGRKLNTRKKGCRKQNN